VSHPPHLRPVPPAQPPISAGRVPPHHLDAEAAVLAAVLLDPAGLAQVADRLRPEHFYADCNGRVFEAALDLAAVGRPVDIVTVAGWLRDRERLGAVGGPAYLALLTDATPTPGNVEAHAEMVREKWRQRSLIATCQRAAAEGYGDVGELQGWIDGIEQEVHEVARKGDTNATQHVGALVATSFARIEDAARRGSSTIGISTGFERLDALTGGMQAGQFWIVAGRPGMGKTSIAMNIAVNAAWPSDGGLGTVGVGVFSLEMPGHEVTTRMVCGEGRVDLGKLRNGFVQPDDWAKLTEAARGVSALPLWVDDTPGLSPMALRSKARRLASECERRGARLGVIVVDHIGLMRAGLSRNANREQEVGECSRSMKELAKELGCTVIALSQLNRQVEMRKDRRPVLSDLRDSGSLEQDCDTAVFMYRDEYYYQDSKTPGLAEAAVLKQRSGPTGKALLRWRGEYTRFETLAPQDYPQHWSEGDES
jgi:replicative DNA helicase